MARVTVEDCMRQVNNRFSLVHLAAKRVRQLREGAPPHLGSKNKEVVLALREIASGDVFPVSADEAEKGRMEAEAKERERLATLAAAQEEAAAQGAPIDDSEEEA